MSRLIDADKLRQSIVNKRNRTVAPVAVIETLNWVIREIRRQPTDYSTRLGEWIVHEKTICEGTIKYYQCNECHGQFNNATKHCPDCGIKMVRLIIDS